jgi:hypothetical protein
MKRAIIAMIFAALMQPTDAHADGLPAWSRRATAIAAHILVPKPGSSPDNGVGFFVGLKDDTAYLVTAAHVIWPGGERLRGDAGDEKVNLSIDLGHSDCAKSLPAVASSEQADIPPPSEASLLQAPATTHEDPDVALVKVDLRTLAEAVRTGCWTVLTHLPRHIIDPEEQSLSKNQLAWLVGPLGMRPLNFESYVGGEFLQFTERFLPGDSGSPIFSASGHIIGMVVKDNGLAMRFSAILGRLENDWKAQTNLAGSFSKLVFNQYTDAQLSIGEDPSVPLERPHPVPRGPVNLKLRTRDDEEAEATVVVRGPYMSCEVAFSRWLARKRHWEVGATAGFFVATGGSYLTARVFQNRFEDAPTKSSRVGVRIFNGVTIGAAVATLAALAVTVIGYRSSEQTSITCSESTVKPP